MLRAEAIDWRTLRPAFAYELEAGFSPEVDKRPWLHPAQMALARTVFENEIRRHGRGIRDRTGEKHGRLEVLGLARMSGKTSTWRCRCTCGSGKITIIASGNLNTTHSCGCLRRESALRNVAKARAALDKQHLQTKGRTA